MRSRWLLGLFLFIALSIPLNAYPGDQPQYSFDQVKAARLTRDYDGRYGSSEAWTTDMFIEAVYKTVK